LNKSDVIERVAGAAEVGKQQAERVLDAFFDTVKGAVGSGDRVGWPGFGSFSATQRTARTGRNPQTGEPVKIPASRAVKFSAGSALKDFMKSTGTRKSGAAKKKAAAPGKTAAKQSSAAKKAPAKKAPAKKASAAKATAAKKTPAKKSAAATKKR
jgi:DNA-binding protein HU-beta